MIDSTALAKGKQRAIEARRALARRLQRYWWRCARAIRRAAHKVDSPLLCYLCVALGVESTMLVPLIVLIALTTGRPPSLAVPQITCFSMTPTIALMMAVLVFDAYGYERWQAALRDPLRARMLRAFGDGAYWWRLAGNLC
jgi:hypothetical protein